MIAGKDGQRLFPIILLSAAGFTVLTTEFIIVGLLPAVATDLRSRVDSMSTTLASRILGVEVTTSVTATGSGR